MQDRVVRLVKVRFQQHGKGYDYRHQYKVSEKYPTYVMSPFGGRTKVIVVKFHLIIADPDDYGSVLLPKRKSLEQYTQEELNTLFMQQNPATSEIPLFSLMRKIFS